VAAAAEAARATVVAQVRPSPPPAAAEEAWEVRLRAIVTILEQELTAEETEAPAVMPRSQLVVQLRALQGEVDAALAAAHTAASEPTAQGGVTSSVANLEQQVEALSVALAKAQLDGRQKAEKHRRTLEALQARVDEAETETLDRMRIVAESVQAETDVRARVTDLEEELAAVRSKAGARMKELIASNKALDDQVAQLTEIEELNRSKIAAMEASLSAADADHNRVARAAQSEAAKQQEELAYARALVLRYLELESQHEALFPAIAAAFRFTQQEVQRIHLAQEQHQQDNSLWGKTRWFGSRIVGVAREVAQEASAGQ